MNSLKRFCFALAFALVASTPALADPALWAAKSSTATIYLFGTVHVLPDGTQWRYPALDKALAASGKLYVEEDDDDPVTMQLLVLQYGMDLQHPLSGKLDTADRARLDDTAKAAGVTGGSATLDAMRPWLAALTIAVAPIVKAGYDPKSGADKQLEREFRTSGRPIGAFETAEQQIKFLADLSPALQLDLLRNALDEYAEGPAQIGKLIGYWQSGNVAAIAVDVSGTVRRHYPELYEVLLVDRNRAWARRIETLLEDRGTILVAVGAGHLAGPDSVLVQLRELGVETERVH